MRRALVLLCLTATVSGCAGQTLTPSEEAGATVQTFLDQCARERGVNALPELVPAAQTAFLEAGGTLEGCARVVGFDTSQPVGPDDFAAATVRVAAASRARGTAVVTIAGQRRALTVSFGEGLWRIEGR